MENRNILTNGTLLQGGRLQVVKHLGSGGFGNTYEVVDTTTGQRLAMKEFYLKGVNERDADSRTVSVSNADNKDEFLQQKEKFHKEAFRLSNIHHPNVVAVFGMFEENGTAYYIMEYLQGQSLAERIKAMGHPLPEREVTAICTQLLNALEAVHQQNIWHLDLKPGNVIMAGDGRIVLIDFGASKQFHDANGHSLSTSTGLCYTPGYAPTEQIANESNRIGPWTDLYALGATMYNLLTGQTPPSVSAIQDGEGFRFPPTVTPETQRMVRWLMEPNRNHRPQSVFEVRQSMGMVPTLVAEQENNSNNRKWWIIGACAALLAIAGVVLWLLLSGDSKKRHNDDDEYDEEYEEAMMEEEDVNANAALEDEYDINQAIEDSIRAQQQRIEEEIQKHNEAIEAQLQEERARQEQLIREEQERIERQREEQLQAQQQRDDEQTVQRQEETKVFEVVEQMPQFPGGDAALVQYLSSHIKYPVVAEENGIQGRVICTFVVERNGSITNVRVVKSVDPSLDKEAVRVLKGMPNWVPGKQDGSAVRVKYTVPVTFRLQ
ncbi:MAG: TonB family protein [Prevotella sp.]|nr:TonB family protein [Prevotella sp.]